MSIKNPEKTTFTLNLLPIITLYPAIYFYGVDQLTNRAHEYHQLSIRERLLTLLPLFCYR
ncbi:MAG: hypothetical protein OQL27_13185 [Sedimenticola sp.]|nr:hypothetical protein [Sedimenticola sp.]